MTGNIVCGEYQKLSLIHIQQHLKNQMTADSKLKVEITECDHTKGVLSVKVVETYKIPSGKTRTVSCEKTGVVEE